MARMNDIVRRAIAAVEPWYDWGETSVCRLAAKCADFTDESTGPARFFEVQWLGFHIGFTVGRTPPEALPAEVAARKEHLRIVAAELGRNR